MQDCASSNKIKENKYKILRMSLLLGSDENKEETLNNFEDAAREIDAMNDEIYLKDLEDKFYDTLKLEEEEKKLSVLVDYIGGRVEQRISLLSDFANVTGFDLQNLPPIKYYDKLDDYKERLKYIREYLENMKRLDQLNQEVGQAEEKLKSAYMTKASSEEFNQRNEEIILNKFHKMVSALDSFKEVTESNVDTKLEEVSLAVEESKKSLDIFTKSFTTLTGSGISYEEEQEYHSYVLNAQDVYYANKEQEYLLKIYQLLLHKENEFSKVLTKRECINDILYERMALRKELNIEDNDILNSLYDLLERQYEDIQRQRENIENIETLNDEINHKKEEINELELDNQKVEILALLREFCMIDTYNDVSVSTADLSFPEIERTPSSESSADDSSVSKIETDDSSKEEPFSTKKEETVETPKETSTDTPANDIFSSPISSKSAEQEKENVVVAKDNQVISVEDANHIDLDLVHSKADKVMRRVGDMLGIKTKTEQIVSVSNPLPDKKETPPISSSTKEPLPENPLFTNHLPEETNSSKETVVDPELTEQNNFWFSPDTPDALNELPDLEVSNDNFFANTNIPDLNFPDLKIDFGSQDTEAK